MSSLPLRVNDDTDAKAFYYFTDTVWSLTGSGVPDKIEDANGNTRVQTEKFPDQDIIRFDLDGTEEMVLPKNANGQGRLEFPDAQKNTFIGDNAGESAITGIHNVALCFDALRNNTYGNFNTAIGFDAMRSNTSGWGNVAMGKGAPSGCRLKPGCKGRTGMMDDGLRALQLIPLTEPYYQTPGFTHVGRGGGDKTKVIEQPNF